MVSARNSSLRIFALICILSACAGAEDQLELPPTAATDLPFTTLGDHLAVWDGREHVPLFVKAVNLGVAVPGTLAGELAASREQYDRWLEQIGELGFNAIRTYTLHYPRFYDALLAYNRAHPRAPLYLLHGVWLDEENPSQDLFALTDVFAASIREAVDCAHGRCEIAERRGRAFGRYRADISAYLLGWIIGREVTPREIRVTNEAHAERSAFKGSHFSIANIAASEVWFTMHLDTLVAYEREHYRVERPVSVSSWPTLDPLEHPSEPAQSGEDNESLDLESIENVLARGGYFASYHAYPYYPDFITRDPAYLDTEDAQGPNSYFAYLQDLRRYYAKHPLLIAEFGVPTSWGNAHEGAAMMSHGGENEREQGEFGARLLQNIWDAQGAGGALFAWIDEWWKRSWTVDELAFPRSSYPLWHNVTSPEQNFGLIAFELPKPQWERWPAVEGNGAITKLEADVDAEYFQLRLQLTHALDAEETLTLGIDTYADELGETCLPGGARSERRNELALVLRAAAADLYVTRAYDLYGIWHKTSSDEQLYHSVASDACDWVKVRWQNNLRRNEDGSVEIEVDPIGELVVASTPSEADNRTGVILDGSVVHIRLPWTLLQFTDPTTRTVMDDDRATPERETRVSDGIALSLQLGAARLETQRFRWEGWTTAPQTTERLKRGAALLSQRMQQMPGLISD